MEVTLYAIPGSHPCATVERALEVKRLDYDRVDMIPGLAKLLQHRRFGGMTVPGLEIDGERVLGSRAILRRLEELAPEPPLYPAGEEERAEVERAEEWGDEVLQPLARRISWALLKRAPRAMNSYGEGADLPAPIALLSLGNRPLAMGSARANGASDPNVRADLINLPHHLDRIEGWIAAGVLGGPQPNAADLQIGASLRLLLTFGDVAPMLEGRPAAELARAQFPTYPGHVPAGTLATDWLPAPA